MLKVEFFLKTLIKNGNTLIRLTKKKRSRKITDYWHKNKVGNNITGNTDQNDSKEISLTT